MVNLLKAEWMKEKRTANKKLFLLVPIIFISYSVLISSIMGTQPDNQSFLVVTAYNWYPLMILPLFISLLCCNSLIKEKKHKNDLFYRTLDISTGKMYVSKMIITALELGVILFVSFLLLLLFGKGVFHDPLDYTKVLWATGYLFAGSLPLIPLSFLIYRVSNYFVVILVNFILSVVGATVALEPWWSAFPWCYNLRMIAASLGIHPNGTLIEPGSYLLDSHAIVLG